jgi:hypothetical protein
MNGVNGLLILTQYTPNASALNRENWEGSAFVDDILLMNLKNEEIENETIWGGVLWNILVGFWWVR